MQTTTPPITATRQRSQDLLSREILDYLSGYARSNSANLMAMGTREDWRRLAIAEQERRRASVLQMLDDESLDAIASGFIDFQTLCQLAVQGQKVPAR